MPLRLLCANKGYVLDIQDDLWSSPNLDRAYNHLLTLQEDLNGNALEFQSEPKEDENVDVALVSEIFIQCNKLCYYPSTLLIF